MKISEALLLLAAGTLGGIFSTVVSIASLVTYPVLLALGVPPLSANMTNTVSLVLTGAGSVLGSKPELAGQGRRVIRLGIVTALGGAAGAAVLLLTPASTFIVVVPVLIGGASLVLLLYLVGFVLFAFTLGHPAAANAQPTDECPCASVSTDAVVTLRSPASAAPARPGNPPTTIASAAAALSEASRKAEAAAETFNLATIKLAAANKAAADARGLPALVAICL